MKRINIISYLIILMMLFSAIPKITFAADVDITEKEGLLQSLEIIGERTSSVSRGDFAEIIVKAMSIEKCETAEAGISFVDVDRKHPKYEYIATAKMMGIMRGYSDSIFSPDKEITAEEAISVVVSCLGDMRVYSGMSYYDAARDNKLLKDMNGVTGAPLSYEQMVILIYNFLHSNMYDEGISQYLQNRPGKGDNVLEKFFNIKFYEGIVYADDYAAIKGNPMKEKFLRVGDKTFFDELRLSADMLGNYIKCYYTDDGMNSLVYAYADNKKTDVVILPLDETINADGELKYEEEAYKYDESTAFIYNSELIAEPTVLDTAFSGSGTVKLIDSDDDSVYDAVIIEKYTVGEIESINSHFKYIKLDGSPAITYEDYRTVNFSDIDGNLRLSEDFITGNVVCIAVPVSKNGALKIVKCESNGAAVFSVINKDEKTVITNEGLEYKAMCDINELKPNEEYELYIDKFGNLVYTVKNTGIRRFGYVINADVQGTFGGSFKIRILDNSNEVKLFEQKEEINVRLADGSFKKMKGNELINTLKSSNDGYIRQPVLYLLNNDNTIKEIWIASSDLEVEFHTLDSLLEDLTESERGSMNYRKGAMNVGGKFQLGADTVLYRVPRYDLDVKNEELDLQVANAYTYLASSAFNSKSIRKYGDSVDGTGILTAISFDKDAFNADVLIIEEATDMVTLFGASTQQPMIVTEIKYAIDEEGNDCIKVSGYTSGGFETSFKYYDEDSSGLVGIVNAKRSAASMEVASAEYAPISCGDIIKHNSAIERVKKNHIEIYYRNDINNDGKSDSISYDNLMQHQTTQSTYRFYDYARVTPATVVSKQGSILRMEVCDLRNSGLDSGVIGTREEVFSIGAMPVYIYSKAEGSIKYMTGDIISEGDTFLFMSNGGLAQFAVYYK